MGKKLVAYFSASGGQKAFALFVKVSVNNITRYCLDNCIAEKFETLVVEPLAAFGLQGIGTVRQCLLVYSNVAGIETENGV